MKDLRNYSLLGHNTFGIDAKCIRFLEYASYVEEAQQVVANAAWYKDAIADYRWWK